MKRVISRGLTKSQIFLSNVLNTASFKHETPLISLSFSSNQNLNSFIKKHNNKFTLYQNVLNSRNINDKDGNIIRSAFLANSSNNINDLLTNNISAAENQLDAKNYESQLKPFEDDDSKTSNDTNQRPNTIDFLLLSNKDTIIYENEVKNVLQLYSEIDVNKIENFNVLKFKNIALINPPLSVLDIVRNYYKKNDIDGIEKLNIIGLINNAPAISLYRKNLFAVGIQEKWLGSIPFDLVNFNNKNEKRNSDIDFLLELNNDHRDLISIKEFSQETHLIKQLERLFIDGYLTGLQILYDIDLSKLTTNLGDEEFEKLLQYYIKEFQWFVSWKFPELIKDYGNNIEESPFSKHKIMDLCFSVANNKNGAFNELQTNEVLNKSLNAKINNHSTNTYSYIQSMIKIEEANKPSLALHYIIRACNMNENPNIGFKMRHTSELFRLCYVKLLLNKTKRWEQKNETENSGKFLELLLNN
ncbi:hypothetical protein ACO0SA_004287 [Hanseniaspora valbyensis]